MSPILPPMWFDAFSSSLTTRGTLPADGGCARLDTDLGCTLAEQRCRAETTSLRIVYQSCYRREKEVLRRYLLDNKAPKQRCRDWPIALALISFGSAYLTL